MEKITAAYRGSIETADEFGIYTDIADFPVTEYPAYLLEAVGGVCLAGSMTLTVFDLKFRITTGMVVTLLPWQLVSVKDISPDFQMTFLRISKEMFTDALSSMWRLRPGFFFYMRKHIASEPDETFIPRFMHFCNLLAYWNEHAPENCRRESVLQLLRFYYWTIYAVYINDSDERKTRYSHKEELAFRFMQLIIENHSPDKNVSYYAGRLGVSAKYLTNLIRSISGRSARDWIVYYTILEIKSLLRDSSMDIKSVTIRTNFPDQSTLSRFFRHYTGMTPSQYRESIHF